MTNSSKNPEGPLARLGLKGLFMVWYYPHGAPRSQWLAQALGLDLRYIYLTRKRGWLYTMLKYPAQAVQTFFVLIRLRPQIILVQNPPIFGVLAAYLWGLLTGTRFIIDSHTDALLASFWAWSLPLHRFLSRRAVTTIVTNDHLKELVQQWDAPAMILTDVPLPLPERTPPALPPGSNVAIVSTASYDEPIEAVLAATRTLSNINFHITGNYRHKPQVISAAPQNVRFTGYMPMADYYGLLEAADFVICLTTQNHTMQNGASEALWLGRPIITSDWPMLRKYFNRGTIHVDNSTAALQQAINSMCDNLPHYKREILALREERQREWEQKVGLLAGLIMQSVSEGQK